MQIDEKFIEAIKKAAIMGSLSIRKNENTRNNIGKTPEYVLIEYLHKLGYAIIKRELTKDESRLMLAMLDRKKIKPLKET